MDSGFSSQRFSGTSTDDLKVAVIDLQFGFRKLAHFNEKELANHIASMTREVARRESGDMPARNGR